MEHDYLCKSVKDLSQGPNSDEQLDGSEVWTNDFLVSSLVS